MRSIRVGVLSLLAGVAVFAAGFGLFADYVSSLATPSDPGTADAVIVVTGGKSRLEAAVGLLKSGKGERLLISGVHPNANLDDLRAATGGDKSLFKCCVDVDYAALDTIGNAQESAKWLKDHAYASAILVTNNYHMPRTMLEMKRVVGAIDFVPYPVVNKGVGSGSWLTSREVLRVLFTEYTKYLAALARGVIPAEPPAQTLEMVDAAPTSG
ncbi:YdcF family protein [Arvimicrobium flavum]|uniref:YdcF family protein n=1 Tax=Arvimicrobium flavum TaxID=3393320 RepID=UPI00237A1698|nr:YdcF family protein [Mesorhizobium shangrilense]